MEMEKIAAKQALSAQVRRRLTLSRNRVQSELTKIGQQKRRNAFSRLKGSKRMAYGRSLSEPRADSAPSVGSSPNEGR